MEKIKQNTEIRQRITWWLIMTMAVMTVIFLKVGVTVQAEENDTPVSISGTTYIINGQQYDSEYYLPELSIGDELTFKVETKGGIGNISYQWYYEEVPGEGFKPIDGQTQDTLAVSKKEKRKETYCCEVKDESTDNRYNDYRYFYIPPMKTLTVTGYINGEAATTIEAKENDTITLKVDAQTMEDESKITYKWVYGDWTELSDEGNKITVTKRTGNERYYCEIYDGIDRESCYFYLNEKSTVIINKTSYIMNEESYDDKSDLPDLSIGDEITLSVEAESSVSDLSYQWYRWETIKKDGNEYSDYKEISGETQSTLKVKKVDLKNEQYYCKVSDDKKSNNAYFVIPSAKTLKITPYISADGNEKEDSNITIVKGKSITMKVDAISSVGNDKITYQWYDNTSDEPIKGATKASYTVEKGSGYESYYCDINDTVNSTRCCFNLEEEDTFSDIETYINDRVIESDGGTVCKKNTKEGNTYRFRVVPTSTYENATYTYRWYKSDNEEKTLGTGSKLSVTKSGELEDTYYVDITNDAGTTKTIEFTLKSKTTDGLSVIAYTDGKYYGTSGFSTYRVDSGKTVKLHIDALAKSGEDITYDWQKMDRGEWEYISTGQTGDTYTTEPMDSDEESYRCVITCGKEKKEANFTLGLKRSSDDADVLSVSDYIIVNGVKEDGNWIKVDTGTKVTMGVSVKELPESIKESDLSYEWYKSSEGESNSEKLSDKKECTVIPTASDEEYLCKIKVNGKDKISEWFYMDVYPDITADISIDGKLINKDKDNNYEISVDSFEELYGKKVSIEAKNKRNADDEFSYKWYKVSEEGLEDKEELLSETKEFTLTKNILSDERIGMLYCLVTNKEGIKESMSVTLYVYDYTEDDIEQYINDENTVDGQFAAGTKVTLKIKLPEQVSNKMTYEWYDEDGNKIDCKGAEYTVIKSNDEESYTCTVTDPYGRSRDCDFTLYLETELVPQRYVNGKKQPEMYCKVKPNSTLTLEVKVKPEDGVTYQWYTTGEEDCKEKLTGETKSVLSVKSGDYLYYACLVTRKNERAWVYFDILEREEICSHKNTEVIPAVAATCEKNGLTEGKRCKKCGETIVEQEVVEATGHKWDNGVVTTPATATETGVKTFTCTVCKKTRTEVIPKLMAQEDNNSEPTEITLKTGTKITDKKSKASYKVTGNKTVQYIKASGKEVRRAKKVAIPAAVTVNGVKYQVTAIAANAFKNNRNLKTVVIPESVRSIGKQAFAGCKNLRSITIKTPYLTKKSVGAKAFKGISTKATIKVPKKQLKAYKKLLKTKGIGKKVKIK